MSKPKKKTCFPLFCGGGNQKKHFFPWFSGGFGTLPRRVKRQCRRATKIPAPMQAPMPSRVSSVAFKRRSNSPSSMRRQLGGGRFKRAGRAGADFMEFYTCFYLFFLFGLFKSPFSSILNIFKITCCFDEHRLWCFSCPSPQQLAALWSWSSHPPASAQSTSVAQHPKSFVGRWFLYGLWFIRANTQAKVLTTTTKYINYTNKSTQKHETTYLQHLPTQSIT